MTETESTQVTKQVKSDKQKVDKRTIVYMLLYILFITVPVTLLMPRSGLIGIILQIVAGLIFLLQQFWEKILKMNPTEKLTKVLNSKDFQSRMPLLAIIFVVPLLLVFYFRFTRSTDIPLGEALISIIGATLVACTSYLFAVVNSERWVHRLVQWIRQKLGKVVEETSPNYPITNLVLLILSLVFFALIILIVPISGLFSSHSVLAIALSSFILVLLMFLSCIFVLSLLYFSLLMLLKAGIALQRRYSNLSDVNRDFARQLFWALLLASWLWGGILIAINM